VNDELQAPIALPADIVDALERVRPRFPGAAIPGLLYFPSVGSTNDLAARLAASDPAASDGWAIVAEQQTAGRGRLGRAWFSPPGAGLYLSIVVRPPCPVVTLAAAVAFATALRACAHLMVDIKWPNDLVIARRKLAGILTEGVGTDVIERAVVGVGINLRTAAYPADLADRATSIESELGRPIEPGIVLAECLASFSERVSELRDGQQAAVLDRWRSLSPSAVGAPVKWVAPDGPREGTTAGLDADGALLVLTAHGVERVIAGEIRWL
jgi:BirA family transcriptional regulator, biotin operon repressor / biotin---[acetyl-CoA-carboxylase] ligase